MSLQAEARRGLLETRCFICLERRRREETIYHASYGVVTCKGECYELFTQCTRDPSTSSRGSWRPRADVLRIAVALRA